MKAIAIILAFYMFLGGLFPQMDYSQLGRLDNFMEHYKEHSLEMKALNGDILCIFEFIQYHFISQNQHDHQDHEEKHSNLPFQSINSSLVLVATYTPILPQEHIDNKSTTLIPLDAGIYNSGYTASIFQPPAFLA